MTKKAKKTVKIVIACLFVAVLIGFIVCEVWFIFVGFPNHHCGKEIYSFGKDNESALPAISQLPITS